MSSFTNEQLKTMAEVDFGIVKRGVEKLGGYLVSGLIDNEQLRLIALHLAKEKVTRHTRPNIQIENPARFVFNRLGKLLVPLDPADFIKWDEDKRDFVVDHGGIKAAHTIELDFPGGYKIQREEGHQYPFSIKGYTEAGLTDVSTNLVVPKTLDEKRQVGDRTLRLKSNPVTVGPSGRSAASHLTGHGPGIDKGADNR